MVKGHHGFPTLVLQESLVRCCGQYVGPNRHVLPQVVRWTRVASKDRRHPPLLRA
ncbi:hypothetical protein [Lentzea sp. CA-135723]|uniref:hypothetical protein n=1 Tax=Lentzea sp. CA-135723 TaxID=3239950 RepID=UPI003D8A29FA